MLAGVTAEAPEILYHYTNGSALDSIIQHEQLWGSDPLYLNDAQELRRGKERLEHQIGPGASALARLAYVTSKSDGVYDGSQAGLWQEALDFVARADTFRQGDPHVYVTCFCSDGDLLSQWRGYGNGGYAIGFDRKSLEECDPVGIVSPAPGEFNAATRTHLIAVAYEDEEVERRVTSSNVMESTHSATYRHPAALWRCLEILASFKDPGFREENEWRLMYVKPHNQLNGPNVKFRQGQSSLVPYIEYAVRRPAIRRIVVGPGGNMELREMAIRRMLDVYEVEADVVTSRVPYRGV